MSPPDTERRPAGGNLSSGAPSRSPSRNPEPIITPPADINGSRPASTRQMQLEAALLDDDGIRRLPAPRMLIAGWLQTNSLAWLYGAPASAKTFVALDIAGCIANGIDWHRHAVEQGPVLYVIAEGISGVGPRIGALRLAHGLARSNIIFLPIAVQLLTATDVDAFRGLLAKLRPALIVIDTQARATVGGEENSARDMGLLVDALEQLRAACGACVLVVHHQSRVGETLRGSTALEGAATTIINCSKDGPRLTLVNTKQKDAAPADPMVLALATLGESAVVSHDAVGLMSLVTDTQHKLLATLRDQSGTNGVATTRLFEASGLPKATYYRALADLKRRGLVTEYRNGRSVLLKAASDDDQLQVSLVSPGLTGAEVDRSQVSHPLRGETQCDQTGATNE